MFENVAPVRTRASMSRVVQSQISTWNPSWAIRRTRSSKGSSRKTISAQTASVNIGCTSLSAQGATKVVEHAFGLRKHRRLVHSPGLAGGRVCRDHFGVLGHRVAQCDVSGNQRRALAVEHIVLEPRERWLDIGQQALPVAAALTNAGWPSGRV